MSKTITRVPISLSAESESELTQKCLRNNKINDMEFDYKIIHDGKKWVAWFMVDVTKLKGRVR